MRGRRKLQVFCFPRDGQGMAGLIGRVYGGYRILDEIGRGGMATVFRAWDRKSRRVVAVKFLSPFLCRDARFRARFRREARLLQDLRHPKIVPVLEYGEEGELVYLVMPYITVGSLSDRLKQGPISVEAGRKVMAQVAEAIQFAHDHGIIHRDIKPANILIDENYNAWLSDFGFARAHDQPSSITGSTIIGTPAYMAPEQILAQKVTPKADQYALAIILFQMSTGQLPFEADTPMGQALKHATEPLPRPRAINPRLPDAVEAVLVRALSKDPNFRYGSVGEFYQAFDTALSRSIDPASGRLRPGAVGRAPRPLRRRAASAHAGPTLAGRTLAGLTRVLPNPTYVRRLRPLVVSLIPLLALPLMVWGAARIWHTLSDSGPALAALMETPALRATVDALSTAFAWDEADTLSPDELHTAVAGTLLPVFAGTQTAQARLAVLNGDANAMLDAALGGAGPAPADAGGGQAQLTPGSGAGATLASEGEPTATASPAAPIPFGTPASPTRTPNPPSPTAGIACSLIDLGGFSASGKKVSWNLHNGNGTAVLLTAVRLSWPVENGALFKIALNGSTIWVGAQETSPASVGGWIGGESSRLVADTAGLEFRFDGEAGGSGYSVSVDFDGGCSASAGH